LRDLGYVEGRNIQFEYRSAEGDRSRLKELATDLVSGNVDIIVTWQTPTVMAAKQATQNIPIVMADSGDPVGTGLITSLARPGGNVSGMAGVTAELAGKSVELVRQIIPSSKQVAALCNGPDPFSKPFLEHVRLGGKAAGVAIKPIILSSNDQLDSAYSDMSEKNIDAVVVQPSLATKRTADLALQYHLPTVYLRSFEAAPRSIAVEVTAAPVRDTAEAEEAIAKLGREPGGGLIVPPDAFTIVHDQLLVRLAQQHRVPAVYSYRISVARGGLMSYGPDPFDNFRRSASYVDRIFKGAKPADLPVQQPTKFELIINLKTAKTLGLDVPPALLARADEVIE
jgi:putative ABC transport system substrate-binding protein